MRKDSVLQLIAEKAYDVGYSAKLHFSTYEIVEKGPGWIAFISMTVGVLSLVVTWFAEKEMSAAIIILGVVGMYVAYYFDKKDEYFTVGQRLTALFNRLKRLSAECESSTSGVDEYLCELEAIEREFNSICLSKHICGASWLAHKKFFWEQQIGWIDKYINFRFFRDKVPLSLYVTIACVLLAASAVLAYQADFTDYIQRMCAK